MPMELPSPRGLATVLFAVLADDPELRARLQITFEGETQANASVAVPSSRARPCATPAEFSRRTADATRRRAIETRSSRSWA